MQNFIQCANHRLNLDSPKIMGVLNVTPDSFSDGGQFISHDLAYLQAETMVEAGADIIDVGGESTRPGAESVSTEQELDRVIPVIEKIHQNLDVIISIDTSKAEVMQAAAQAGAGMINDVMALQEDNALEVARETGLPVCLMHMQGKPRTMQDAPQYHDVVKEVCEFLQQRADICLKNDIDKEKIIIDPGFGFGKTLEHNILLFKHLEQIQALGFPVLVGASRKTMIGEITNKPVSDRLSGSLALATLAAQKRAAIIRVHDVEETIDAVKVACALT